MLCLGDGNVEIEVVAGNDAREQDHEDNVSGVLKVSDLHLRGSELDAPA